MKPPFLRPVARRSAGLCFSCPGNLLLVHEVEEERVSIYATSDNFNPEQQESFIRYLRAEGFLNGEGEWLGSFHERGPDRDGPPVRWIVDPSWPKADAAYALHVQRLCWCAAGTMLAWLALMAALVCC